MTTFPVSQGVPYREVCASPGIGLERCISLPDRVTVLQGFFGHHGHPTLPSSSGLTRGSTGARHTLTYARKISEAPSAIRAKPAACPQVSDSFNQKTEKPENTSSVITSCMVFSWAAE